MISISVGFHPVLPQSLTLVMTGLIDGQAVIGETLGARLSDGATLSSFAWGSASGLADYGTDPELVVPAAAEGGVIHLSAEEGGEVFTSSVAVINPMVPETRISVDPDEIIIETLAPLPPLSGLSATPTFNNITVEIV